MGSSLATLRSVAAHCCGSAPRSGRPRRCSGESGVYSEGVGVAAVLPDGPWACIRSRRMRPETRAGHRVSLPSKRGDRDCRGSWESRQTSDGSSMRSSARGPYGSSPRPARPSPRSRRIWGSTRPRRPVGYRGPVTRVPRRAAGVTFNSVLKVEYVHRHTFAARAEARIRIAAWITDFYDARRLHSVCGFRRPIDCEHDRRASLTEGPGPVVGPAARLHMSRPSEGRSAGHAAVAASRRSKASFASRSTAVASWLPRRHAAW
jgi:hypothetical protein